MSSKLYSPKTKSFQKCKHVNPKLQKPVFQENLGHTVKPTRWGKKTWQQMRHEWISLAAIFKLYLFIKLFCFKCSSNLIFCRFQTNFSQFGQFFVFTATANPRQKWNLPSDKSIQFWHFLLPKPRTWDYTGHIWAPKSWPASTSTNTVAKTQVPSVTISCTLSGEFLQFLK
jgi:hypothetical protein